jgi:hypothetical protein
LIAPKLACAISRSCGESPYLFCRNFLGEAIEHIRDCPARCTSVAHGNGEHHAADGELPSNADGTGAF